MTHIGGEPTRAEGPASAVVAALDTLLRRRGLVVEIGRDSDLFDDLELDSLEVAELSAMLEDELGHDPYSVGLLPRTVGEVVAFYDG